MVRRSRSRKQGDRKGIAGDLLQFLHLAHAVGGAVRQACLALLRVVAALGLHFGRRQLYHLPQLLYLHLIISLILTLHLRPRRHQVEVLLGSFQRHRAAAPLVLFQHPSCDLLLLCRLVCCRRGCSDTGGGTRCGGGGRVVLRVRRPPLGVGARRQQQQRGGGQQQERRRGAPLRRLL